MRIAYVLDAFPTVSGTFVAREVAGLLQRGVAVRVFALRRPAEPLVHGFVKPLLGETQYLTAHTSRVGRACGHLRALVGARRAYGELRGLARTDDSRWLLRQAAAIAPHVAGWDPTHLHTHFAADAAEICMYLSGLLGVPFSFTAHAYDIFTEQPMVGEKCRRAAFVATISEFNRRFLTDRLGAEVGAKVRVVRCGVDLAAIGGRPAVRHSVPQIVSVGRLVAKKGHEVLLCALASLRDLSWAATVVGDGPERGRLEQRRADLGLADRVDLPGELANEEVARLVAGADVFALACRQDANGDMDGIPVALMEAMALRVPVISTSLSGIPELVRDGAGLLVASDQPEAVAEAVRRVLSLPPDQRRAMGAAGRRVVQDEFTLDGQVERLMTLFEQHDVR